MRFLLTLFLFLSVPFFGKSQTLNVFMSTTPETIYGGCNGTITLWVEGASAADSFMFLLDFDPLPIEYDTIIVQDTIVTITGVCPGSYTATLDTLWGSCPIYGGGCCNCIGSTSCGGAAGAGASGTVGAAAPSLSFTVGGTCPDPCNPSSFGNGSAWVNIIGQAPPFLVNFGPQYGGWTSSTGVSFPCQNTFPSVISVKDATGQIVTQTNVVNCQSCGKSAILGNVPTIQVCAGQTIGPINFNSYLIINGPWNANQGKFSWTNNNTATGIPASSPALTNAISNNLFSFTAPNVTSTQVSTITLVSNPWNYGTLTPVAICNGNTITFNVVVNPAPNINAGNDLTVCSGAQVTLSGSGGTSYTWNNGVINNVAFTPPVGTTTYQVAGASAFGCNGSDQVQITVNALPVINAGMDQTICAGGQVTLSGSGGTSYAWNNGVVNNAAFVPAVGTTSYQVIGTNANGCQNSDLVTVTANALPLINAGIDQAICDGDQVTLSGSGGTSYVWNNGVLNNAAFVPAVGTTSYQVTGTGSNGCQNSDLVSVTVNALPTVDAGIDQSICDGDQVTLAGSGGTTYMWDSGISDNVAFTPTLGTTTYEVTGTDANGCENTDQVDVLVNALPTVDAGIDQSICDGDQVTLAGSGGTTYMWDSGISDNVAFTPTLGTTTYEVTGTDANGCENMDQVDVLVNALPTIDGGVDQTICEGDQITLAGSGGTNYVWNNGISDNVAFTPAIGTTTYDVTGTDSNGCENTDEVDVTVNDLPTINGGIDTTICFGDSLLLNASSNGVVDWTGGLANNTYFSPLNNQTELVCTALSVASCQNSDTILVNMLNQINTSLTVNVDEITAISGYSNYEWLYCESDVTIQNGAQNIYTAIQDGNYRVVIRNSQNCYDTSECVIIDYLDVNPVSENELIYLSPNPTTGKVFISNGDQIESIVVFDATGRVVQRLIGKTQTLDFTDLESGQYLIRMTTSDKRSVMARVIKQD